MTSYIAFLRGINVGGNNMIKMQELKNSLQLQSDGFSNVRTYIQSGNILFTSTKNDKTHLSKALKKSILKQFKLDLDLVVFSEQEWQQIIKAAPKDWGKDPAWRHNIFILLDSVDAQQALDDIGELKSDIESATAGKGVIYQSALIDKIGRTTFSKMIGKPVYKQMTIRNYNTATKLLLLMNSL